jgi:hypothetical protein
VVRLARSSPAGSAADERKALHDLLQVHHLPGNELSNREPDEIGGLVDVGEDGRTWALVRPLGSAPRPSRISLLSMVSTSK